MPVPRGLSAQIYRDLVDAIATIDITGGAAVISSSTQADPDATTFVFCHNRSVSAANNKMVSSKKRKRGADLDRGSSAEAEEGAEIEEERPR